MSLTSRISLRTPHTIVVSPVRTTALPFVCDRLFVWMVGWRDWVGVRPEGRVGGVWVRWARRWAVGERAAKWVGGRERV